MGKRVGDYEMKLENMDKRCRELQRKSEVGEEQFRLLKGELDTERKKSLAQEKSFQDWQRELADEKKNLLAKID